MHTKFFLDSLTQSGRPILLALAVCCLLAAGCTAPFAPGFADYETNRDVEKAAADTSIPPASEVGLDDDGTSAAETTATTSAKKAAAAKLDSKLDDNGTRGDEQPTDDEP
jgi:hypothetical protein